ncbi:Aminopeptidase N [Luteitalea pratensis]|uniref:Aminopeptidase N n=2 Tax=Luteitalea pratensis TaxID=1855912 RepID=A0A143PYN9_LUTPR|nr:Aminopeptidase N [Luteitalea pratensis]
MRACAVFLIVMVSWWAPPAAAQPADAVGALLVRMEQALATGADAPTLLPLFDEGADRAQIDAMADESAGDRTTRAVVRERDRQDLADGVTRVIADILIETAALAHVSTWRLDIAPPSAAADQSRRVRAAARLSIVDGLVRLALSERQYAVRDLHIRGEDLDVAIASGVAYAAEVRGMITALVVIGDGEVTFSPKPESEKGQLRLVAGDEVLRSKVSRLFLRVNPADVAQHVSLDSLKPMETDRGMLDRARRLFGDQVGQSYSLDLNDLSRETWNLVPPIGDLLVDMDLARFGQISYARSGGDSEDISLFDRKRRKNLSVYTSQRNLAMRGTRRYNEEDRLDYVVEQYNVDVSFDPARLWLEGRADLDLRITSAAAQTLTLRLAEPLVLRAVTSDEFGRLLALRVRGQNNIVVNLPDSLRRGQTLRLRVAYGGRLPPVPAEREAVTVGQQMLSEVALEPEPRFVYSHRSYWYPQSSVTAFAKARIRVTVPPDFTVLGSGIPDPPTVTTTPDGRPRRAFTFRALQPIRYLSIAISRFVQVVSADVSRRAATATDDAAASPRLSRSGEGVFYDETSVEMWSQPRQTSRARDLLDTTTDIMRFYGDLVDDLPFPSLRLVLAEDTLPGGHSPAYFALLNQPMPGTPFTWARDPVAFDDFPQYFIAHELAHQFWGQAVAGENYHEQWISEGFAQYFALLYAQKVRPKETVAGVFRQMYRSALEVSDQGPIWLGYRLGHMKGESRVFRATVYNKSALVLHMLRRLMGEAAFSRGLQRFYGQSRFRRVGTDDLRAAMETEYGRPLVRFFERWVYGADIPVLRTSWEQVDLVTAGADGQAPAGSTLRLILEQGPKVHDVPVTATIVYADGRAEQVLAVVTDQVTEVQVPATGRVREVRFNEDFGALVRIERKR